MQCCGFCYFFPIYLGRSDDSKTITTTTSSTRSPPTSTHQPLHNTGSGTFSRIENAKLKKSTVFRSTISDDKLYQDDYIRLPNIETDDGPLFVFLLQWFTQLESSCSNPKDIRTCTQLKLLTYCNVSSVVDSTRIYYALNSKFILYLQNIFFQIHNSFGIHH